MYDVKYYGHVTIDTLPGVPAAIHALPAEFAS